MIMLLVFGGSICHENMMIEKFIARVVRRREQEETKGMRGGAWYLAMTTTSDAGLRA